ncbi:hypothetical protein Pelo_17854 [Pelomyxa schiedti]|nr:hypothetical protein Pelo_17854 [Pelomyxa schiedti]
MSSTTAAAGGTQDQPQQHNQSLQGTRWRNKEDPNKSGVVCLQFWDTTAQFRFCASTLGCASEKRASKKDSVVACNFSVDDSVSPRRIHFNSVFFHGIGIFQFEGDKILRLHMRDLSHPEEDCPDDFQVHPDKHHLLLELNPEMSLDGTWDSTDGRPASLIFAGNTLTVKPGGPGPVEASAPLEFMVDSTTVPMQITLVTPEGEAPGIFELLDSDTLRMCLARPGEEAPTQFLEGNGVNLLTAHKRQNDRELLGEWYDAEDKVTMTFDPTSITIVLPGGPPESFDYKTDETTTPKRFTFALTHICIYEILENNSLRICSPCFDNPDAPTVFSTVAHKTILRTLIRHPKVSLG